MENVRPVDNRAVDWNAVTGNVFSPVIAAEETGKRKMLRSRSDAPPEKHNDPTAPIPEQYEDDSYIGPPPPPPSGDNVYQGDEDPDHKGPPSPPPSIRDKINESLNPQKPGGPFNPKNPSPVDAPPIINFPANAGDSTNPVPFTSEQYKKFEEQQKDGIKKFIEELMKNPKGSVAYEYGVYIKLQLLAQSKEYKDNIDAPKLEAEFKKFCEEHKDEIAKLQQEQLAKYTESAFGMSPEEVAAKTKQYMESRNFANYLLTLSPEDRQKAMEQQMAIMTAVDPVGGTEAVQKLMENMMSVDPTAYANSLSKDAITNAVTDAIGQIMILARLGLSVAGALGPSFEKLTDGQVAKLRDFFAKQFAELVAQEMRGEHVSDERWREVTDKINTLDTPEERAAAKEMVNLYRTPKGMAAMFGLTVVVSVILLLTGGVDGNKPNEVMDMAGWVCWIATGASSLVDLGFDVGKIQKMVDALPFTTPRRFGVNRTPMTFAQILQNVVKTGAVGLEGILPSLLKGMGVLNPIGSFLFFASGIYLAPEQIRNGDKLGAGLGITGGSLFGIGGAAEAYGLAVAFRLFAAAPIAAIPVIGQIAYIVGILVFFIMSIVKPGEPTPEFLANGGIRSPDKKDEFINFWIPDKPIPSSEQYVDPSTVPNVPFAPENGPPVA
jgi:hypothetical protein